jgi:hypothetical protein
MLRAVLDLLHDAVQLEGVVQGPATALAAVVGQHPLQHDPLRVIEGQHRLVQQIDGRHRDLAEVQFGEAHGGIAGWVGGGNTLWDHGAQLGVGARELLVAPGIVLWKARAVREQMADRNLRRVAGGILERFQLGHVPLGGIVQRQPGLRRAAA